MATLIFDDSEEPLRLRPSHLRCLPFLVELAELVNNPGVGHDHTTPRPPFSDAPTGGEKTTQKPPPPPKTKRNGVVSIDMRGMPVSRAEFLLVLNRLAPQPIFTPQEEHEECERLNILSLDTMKFSREQLRHLQLAAVRHGREAASSSCSPTPSISSSLESAPPAPTTVPNLPEAFASDVGGGGLGAPDTTPAVGDATGSAATGAETVSRPPRSIYDLMDYFKPEDPGLSDPNAVLWQDFEQLIDPATGLAQLHSEDGKSVLSAVPFSGIGPNRPFPKDCLVLRSEWAPFPPGTAAEHREWGIDREGGGSAPRDAVAEQLPAFLQRERLELAVRAERRFGVELPIEVLQERLDTALEEQQRAEAVRRAGGHLRREIPGVAVEARAEREGRENEEAPENSSSRPVDPPPNMYVDFALARRMLAEKVAPCRTWSTRHRGDGATEQQKENERQFFGGKFFALLEDLNANLVEEIGCRWVLAGGSVLQALCGVIPIEDLDFFLIWPADRRSRYEREHAQRVAELAGAGPTKSVGELVADTAVRGFHSILLKLQARIGLIQRSSNAIGFQVKKERHTVDVVFVRF